MLGFSRRIIFFFCLTAAVAGAILFLAALADSTDPAKAQGIVEDPGATAAMLALCAAALLFLCLWNATPFAFVWKAVAAIQTLGVAYLWYADELGKKANDSAVALEILAYLIAFAVMVSFVLTIIWFANRWDSTSSSDD